MNVPNLQRYGLALLSIAAALIVTLLTGESFQTAPYMLFWGAVIFSATQGLGPGVLAVGLSLVLAEMYQARIGMVQSNLTNIIQALAFSLISGGAIIERQRYRRLRRQAQATRQQLEMVIESAQDFALMSLDMEGNVTLWNSGAENLFQFREDEILGRNFEILFTTEDRSEQIPDFELRVALSEGSSIDERWQIRKDQTTFFASGIVRPLKDEQDQVQGFVKILRDQTVHRVLEQERAELLLREQNSRARLERINALIMHFVAVVSHEVRNPLAAIKGHVSTLLATDVTWSPEQQHTFLSVIDQETDRLTELTNQLLDYTRLESGSLGVVKERTTFDAVLKAVEPQFNVMVPSHTLDIRPPDPSPPLLIDVARVAQVLTNLVGNAVRYCPTDTTIIVQGRVEGDALRIDVIDKGPGIPPDMRGRIFDAFVQLGIDRQHETKGAGLGLSIAKGIVEAHGGRIWIEDKGDAGTTISFTLPIAEDE